MYEKMQFSPQSIREDYSLSQNTLQSGEIHIIRSIQNDCKFLIFGLNFLLLEKASHEYVSGLIIVDD